jgi:dipeptidase D
MENVLKYFKDICAIPHCSGDTKKLEIFLVQTLREGGCEVSTDTLGNIYAKKGSPSICLQAHYDMVCLGNSFPLDIVVKDGWMSAVDSTLGADNGIGVAMILSLAQTQQHFEALLTNDEEIGLIGANGCRFDLLSKKLLNLDSEELGAVFVGCAGGVDVHATKTVDTQLLSGECYELTTYGLKGGHSGVDIDKDIPNGLKIVADVINNHQGRIISIEGGERINSIPVNVKIVALFSSSVTFDAPFISASYRGTGEFECFNRELTKFLSSLTTGVIEYNTELGIPETSENWALASTLGNRVNLSISLRAMTQCGLEREKQRVVKILDDMNFECTTEGKYSPWEIEMNNFIDDICEIYKRFCPTIEKKAIHAGLECASLKRTYPHIMMASVGPTIVSPHSKSESVDVSTVEICYKVVCEILKRG